jgi:hypothetical protein
MRLNCRRYVVRVLKARYFAALDQVGDINLIGEPYPDVNGRSKPIRISSGARTMTKRATPGPMLASLLECPAARVERENQPRRPRRAELVWGGE